MSKPKHLLEVWAQLHRQIRRSKRLVLLTDFDGTLVPIRPAPDQVRLSPSVHNLLSAISEKGVTIGVISGRSLSDLRARVALPGAWYVGTHGFSLCPPKGRPLFLATDEQKRAVARARKELVRRLGGLQAIYLELKPVSVAVHYRNAPWGSRLQALQEVRDVLQESPGLRLLKGKQVWELLPSAPASKWSAIQRILRHMPANGRIVFYLGDDSSDETVFDKLRGITVAVGKSRETRARFFLRAPSEVRRFLQKLLKANA